MIDFQDDNLTVHVGDCRDELREIEPFSVNTCVTSPPYWGLRDYGTASWTGGDAACDHMGKPFATKASINKNTNGGNDVKNQVAREFFRERCGHCGAIRVDSQLGLEATAEEYISNMVKVFRLVASVLRDDGTVWLNLGDSYGSGKQLLGMPWRVALALQADGWILRSEIIWAKPNPMPESTSDRPTKSHEHIFLLAKSEKYYYDADAISEVAVTAGDDRGSRTDNRRGLGYNAKAAGTAITGERRNKRDVWTVSTKPYAGAHFATFPPDLIEPCILAGAPVGGVVLDPFGGSGTTGMVANRLGRRALLIELNRDYAAQIKQRTAQAPLGL
jgi:site-specific DNA-methyltransferase (adenine-specific)